MLTVSVIDLQQECITGCAYECAELLGRIDL